MLEQNSIGYIFPDELSKSSPENQSQNNTQTSDKSLVEPKQKMPEQDWQIVITLPTHNTKSTDERIDENASEMEESIKDDFIHTNDKDAPTTNGSVSDDYATQSSSSGIFPAAARRLASLRDLGAKKIGALKLKLIENKIKSNERGKFFAQNLHRNDYYY